MCDPVLRLESLVKIYNPVVDLYLAWMVCDNDSLEQSVKISKL